MPVKIWYKISNPAVPVGFHDDPGEPDEDFFLSDIQPEDADFYIIDPGPPQRIVRKSPAEIDAILANRKRAIMLAKINQEVNIYICRHYDMGTQASFQAIYVMDGTPQAVKDALLSVWGWVNSVLGYYYTKKAELAASETPHLVTWDFFKFDPTDPGVSLQSLVVG